MDNTKDSKTVVRPPIIAIMGHIDHGKSTLLDYIRKSNIVEGEAGGITQHLSAYEVLHKTKDGKEKLITFLDTPGHAAFMAMRSRGARVADIVILVISAEDGVQEQTREALKQIKDVGVSFIVAITKIDKPNANVEKAKSSLIENEIYLEGLGGDIPYAEISAKTGKGVDDLLDLVLLAAELEELKGDHSKSAEGVVIESHVDPKSGISATLVITDGTLKKGGCVIAEDCVAPVRSMENFMGQKVDIVSFSSPVRITGFNKIPKVGALFTSCSKKKEAELRASQHDTGQKKEQSQKEEGDVRVIIPVILKADVAGTLEAIEGELHKLSSLHAQIKIIHSGVGDISENDLKVASGTENPIIIGFHVKADKSATQMAERLGFAIKLFDVIYKITEWLQPEVNKRIPQEMKEETIGSLEILRVFDTQKSRQVIGGKVTQGNIKSDLEFKIVRRGNVIGRGKILELQQKKVKVSEVKEGTECGMMVESKLGVTENDVLDVVTIHK